MSDNIIIFTDGSCLGNGQNNPRGGWAFIVLKTISNNQYAIDKEFKGAVKQKGDIPEQYLWQIQDSTLHVRDKITNNICEFIAIAKAIEYYKSLKIENSLTIYSDSEYCMNCLTKWINGWMSKGWKKADGKPVQNVGYIKYILSIGDGKVSFVHVKAHSGDMFNERVDTLAKEGVGEGAQM